MKRAAEERAAAVRLHREYAKLHNWVSRFQAIRTRPEVSRWPVNLFRKARRIGGCGNSRCYLCHADKLLGRPRLWELKAQDLQRDGEEELTREAPAAPSGR